MDLEIFLGPSRKIASICFNRASSVGLLRMRCMLLVTMTKVQIFASVGCDFSGPDKKMCGIRIPCQASRWSKRATDRVGACDCLVRSLLIFQISLCFLPGGIEGHQQKARAIRCSFTDNKQIVTAARNLVAVL